MSPLATRMSCTGGAGGAERVIWLTPGTPAITVAGQRRDLTELPPRGSSMTLSARSPNRPVASTPVRRSVVVVVMVMVIALCATACSTKPYKSDKAVRDLVAKAHLTVAQSECIVTAIQNHFKALIKAQQKANNGSPLPADRLKLEVDSALASISQPTASDTAAARRAVAKCAPDALR
jgi:hypothetical protein